MKIAHISDIHVRNYKYHYEYKQVFDQLFDKLKELKPDVIVNTGDTAHTKSKLSPEYFKMTAYLFENLANIAPFHVILGNHDVNVKNPHRLDAVSPIVNALDHKDIHFHKYSKEVDLGDDIVLNVLSILDQEEWKPPTNKDKINIVLYHGAVKGVVTDTGWVMEHGEIDYDTLENYDYALLGDIHKTNQKIDQEGKARYPGSLVQQNFAETPDKGFLLWDIEDKDTYSCDHYQLNNPKPFITINLTPKGRIPKNTNPPLGSRIRLVSDRNHSLEIFRKAVAAAKHRFKPEIITFLNRVSGDRGNIENEVGSVIYDNLRDKSVQERLITDYLKDYNASEEELQQVFDLNAKYNKLAESDEETTRNVSWKIKKLQWDNLFNYGENNQIDFKNVEGTVGVFGKNYSGKSSVLDSLLYTIYNSTSKNIRKNFNIINEHREYGSGKVEIEIGSKVYTIERRSDKYQKKLKGKITDEAKTDAKFSCFDPATGETENLNGTERNETDRKIRKLFGTIDDFMLTSMSSQLGSLNFINEGSTRRKEILAKFLDLEFFDQKFKLAKIDAADLKGALRRLEGRDFETELTEAKKDIFLNEADTIKQKKQCDQAKEEIAEQTLEIALLQAKIDAVPAEPIDIRAVSALFEKIHQNKSSLENKNKELKLFNEESEGFLKKADSFIDDFDLKSLQEKQQIHKKHRTILDELARKLKEKKKTFRIHSRQSYILDGIPCGDKYLSSCKFIKDAYEATKKLEDLQKKIGEISASQTDTEYEIVELDIESVNHHLEQYQQILDKQTTTKTQIINGQLSIQKNINEINVLNNNLSDQQEKIDYYNKNREAIENYNELRREVRIKDKALQGLNNALELCEVKILNLYKTHGSLEQKRNNIKQQKEDLENLREEYSTYGLFMRCFHSNGIAFDLIKLGLPVINNEISKVLANIVDFKVYFETEENKLDIFLQHPRHGPRPLENGSGAEKTLAAMAIRIALMSVSNMPKCNLMILDEPGAALDEEHLESFTQILEMLKNYFDVCILITHIESLKDIVDTTIDITKKNGFASINI